MERAIDDRTDLLVRNGSWRSRPSFVVQPREAAVDEPLSPLANSTLDLPDSTANTDAFGRQLAGRGHSAFPQLCFVTPVEDGTHVLFGSQLGPYGTGEATLARTIWPHLKADMLCLADRGFFSYGAWKEVLGTGAALFWRAKAGRCLHEERRLKERWIVPDHAVCR